MNILLPAFYFLLLSALIARLSFFRCEGLSRKFLIPVFILKIACGSALWYIYTYYYTDRATSDIFKYFDDATVIFSALPSHPLHYLQIVNGINADAGYLQPYYSQMNNWDQSYSHWVFIDNRTVIRFNAIAYLFSFGNYHVHTIFMCFLSLTGLTAIYKIFYPVLPDRKNLLAGAVFLAPSVLFWTSGVLKEGLLVLALGGFLYSFHRWAERKAKPAHIILLLLCGWLLLIVKAYVLLILIPGLIAYFISKRKTGLSAGYVFLAVYAAFSIIALNLYRISPKYDVLYYIYLKHKDFVNVALDTAAGSYIRLKPFTPDFMSLLKNIPSALFTTFFRPHIFEVNSIIIAMAALENLAIILIGITASLFLKKPSREQLPLFYLSMFFVLLLGILIGLVTPVMGAIVRYKVPLLPFLLIVLFMLMDKQMMVKRFKIARFF